MTTQLEQLYLPLSPHKPESQVDRHIHNESILQTVKGSLDWRLALDVEKARLYHRSGGRDLRMD